MSNAESGTSHPFAHRVIQRDARAFAVELPLDDLFAGMSGDLHPDALRDEPGDSLSDSPGKAAGYPLVEDPRATKRTSIIGMFVLRPVRQPWTAPLGRGRGGLLHALRAAEGWCYNVRGADGGGRIADGNPFDAMRLALQYGVVDAVLVGSGTVLAEGMPRGAEAGYLWQPWSPVAWPQLAPLAPDLLQSIERVRRRWQALGVLSARRWPAQIVVSQSGAQRPGEPDLLDASLFSARHPDGSPVECFILTSVLGARRLRARAPAHGLAHRIEAMLMPLSPARDPEQIDIAAVPEALRARLDVRIASHDGGRMVLSRFSEAGALPQLNLTLMRDRSVRELFDSSGATGHAAPERASLDARCELFFSGDHRLPAALEPVMALGDRGEAVQVSFDARGMRGL